MEPLFVQLVRSAVALPFANANKHRKFPQILAMLKMLDSPPILSLPHTAKEQLSASSKPADGALADSTLMVSCCLTITPIRSRIDDSNWLPGCCRRPPLWLQ